MKALDPELYEKIVDAHELTLDAMDHAYKVKTPWHIRMAIGRAQNILIKIVVRYASLPREDPE